MWKLNKSPFFYFPLKCACSPLLTILFDFIFLLDGFLRQSRGNQEWKSTWSPGPWQNYFKFTRAGKKEGRFSFSVWVLDLPLVQGNPAWFRICSLGAELKVAIIKCNFPSTAKVHRFPGSQHLVTFSVYLWLNTNINEPLVLLTLPFPNLFTTILYFSNERRQKKAKYN